MADDAHKAATMAKLAQMTKGVGGWRARKEEKAAMYLGTAERGATLGVKKDQKGPGTQQCQKCLQIGHWTYECKNERAYVARPSRTKQMKDPSLRRFHNPNDQPPPMPGSKEEKEIIRKELQRQIESKRAAKKRNRSPTPSGSSSSDSESDSDSDSSSSSSGSDSDSGSSSTGSDSSSSGSGSDDSDSASSDSDSGSVSSDSDSEEEKTKKKEKKPRTS
mmetsp:Transcript_9711/g.35571  ORF Transcript_9711/g.35571 Transcript_9711/m.35571 type:complete len:219 (-) Transcript_9711:137-793(-)